jgi:hypothetical protein
MTRGEHKLQNGMCNIAGSINLLPVFLFCIVNNFHYIYSKIIYMIEILSAAVLYGVFKYVIPTVYVRFKAKADYKKFMKGIPAQWLMALDKNTNFKKYVYYTIKNDNKLKDFAEKLTKETDRKKKAAINIDQYSYDKELVTKWLNSKPAQEELDKVIKKAYPDKGPKDKYPIKLRTDYTLEGFKSMMTKEAIDEFTDALSDGTTIDGINKFAKKQGLDKIDNLK